MRAKLSRPEMVETELEGCAPTSVAASVAVQVPAKHSPIPRAFWKLQTEDTALRAIQGFLDHIGYRHELGTAFDIRKRASLRHLMMTGREIVKARKKVKCLEAVVAALVLTARFPSLTRVPLSFESIVNGETHHHIVLAVCAHDGIWGSLGLSRCPTLAGKPVKFKTLLELVAEYKACYTADSHTVVGIKLGTPVPHSLFSQARIEWKRLHLLVADDWPKSLHAFEVEIKALEAS